MSRAKYFPPATRKRLLPLVIEAAREDCTIGAMERLAQVPGDFESRRKFWEPFLPIAKAQGTQPYIDAAMAECRRRIAPMVDWVVLS